MAFTEVAKDMNIIAALNDEPNDVDGLSAAELKAKFDEGGLALKQYINSTLLDELEASTAAASLGAVDSGGNASTVQAELGAKYEKPNGGIPKSDLASAVRESLDLADSAIQTADYNPVSKAQNMTQSVGKDANGRLWTNPGDEAVWGNIRGTISNQPDLWTELHRVQDLTATAQTLPEGSSATVTRSQTATGFSFDFGIPRGNTGAKGDKGDTGDAYLRDENTGNFVKFWIGTISEYNALATISSDTLYHIVEGSVTP